jgi:hypothetical protein
MNLADSERMAGVLESLGYACAEEANDADVLIYNTCSIREKAENKLYSALGKQVSSVIVARELYSGSGNSQLLGSSPRSCRDSSQD